MNLTVTFTDSDVVVSIQVPDDMTVSDLRAYALSETGFPESSSTMVFFHNRPLANASTLQEAGLKDDDIVLLSTPERVSQDTAFFSGGGGGNGSGNAFGRASGVNPNVVTEADYDAQIEAARQQILYDPHLLVKLSEQSPELAEALHDPADFQRAYRRLKQQGSSGENAEIDRNLRLALEEMPEAFGSVTMLFAAIEVNGEPVKAFVDSGAQTTLMSPECAERCHLSHLIDKRMRGQAYGVGESTIIGRIHMAPIKIGSSFFACSMMVMEVQNLDFLLGLDMLKHHQAVIDLGRNSLKMGHEELPFLPESETPKFTPGLGQQSTNKSSVPVPSSSQPSLSGQLRQQSPSQVGSQLGSQVGSQLGANQLGTSQSQLNGSSLSASVPQLSNRMAQSNPGPPPGPPPSQLANEEFPAINISNLMNLGFSKQEVIQALRQANGNPDVAASILFG